MRIVLIAKPGHTDSGVGRYTVELERQLRAFGHQVTLVHPIVPCPGWLVRALRRCPGWDLEAFFENYAVWARYPKSDIYHITSQNLATLMLFRRPPGKTVITVHDVIPWLVRHDAELNVYQHKLHALFDRLALLGIARADELVADSDYSANSLEHVIDVSRIRVTTILLGMS